MTVVEMLIVMFIFVLIMAGSTCAYQSDIKRYGFAMEQGMSVSQVQQSVKIMVDEIRRTSMPIRELILFKTPTNSISFFLPISTMTILRKEFTTISREITIKKGVANPSGTPPAYPAGDQTVTTIGDFVRNTANQPLFYYFNSDYPADQSKQSDGRPCFPIEQHPNGGS